MKKIMIDIDDTITDTREILFEYLKQFGKVDLSDPINNKIDIMKGKITCPELLDFYNEYAIIMAKNVSLKNGVKEAMKFFHDNQWELHFISSRIASTYDETKEYFEKNQIPYDYLQVGVLDKKSYCQNNNIDIIIDDSINTCSSLIGTRTRPILFTSTTNFDIETTIMRINTWTEFLNNDEMNELLKLIVIKN